MRRVFFPLMLFAAVSIGHAQAHPLPEPSERSLESWLTSGDPRLVAWGAHDVLAARDAALVPDLLALAAQWRELPHDGSPLTKNQLESVDSMKAVLDALIQMRAAVPPETLRALAPNFGNAVAILLSRLPSEEGSALAFDLYRAKPDRGGYGLEDVSASLLALHPVPGFTARFLADTQVWATVFVITPGAPQMGLGGGSGDCGGWGEEPRRDWPEVGQYTLTHSHSEHGVLVVGGPNAIYAERSLSTRYRGDSCEAQMDAHLTPGRRLRLLSQMLEGQPEALGWGSDLSANIEFHAVPQFYRELFQIIADEEKRFRATAAALAAHGLLTPQEAAQSLPELHISLEDSRGRDADPIPQPAGLPPNVVWENSR